MALAQNDLDRYYQLEIMVKRLRSEVHSNSPPERKRVLLQRESEMAAIREQLDNRASEVMTAWSNADSNLDKRIAYYSRKNPYIANCLEHVEERASRYVSYRYSIPCESEEKGSFTRKVEAGYRAHKRDGQINIDLSVCFRYRGTGDRTQAFATVKDTIPCMEEYFSRHGIKLNFRAEMWVGFSKRCDHKVALYDELKKSNAEKWAIWKSSTFTLNDNIRCALYLHETGHLLGLRDTALQSECSPVEIGHPRSIMRTGSLGGAINTHYMDHEIEQILRPLCEDKY